MILHIPQRVPRVGQQYFRVPLDQSVVAGIQPSMMKTSDDVQRYEAHKRECYFPSERYLRYYKYYTQMNCQLECLTNYTKDSCGCVNFFMPSKEITTSTTISSLISLQGLKMFQSVVQVELAAWRRLKVSMPALDDYRSLFLIYCRRDANEQFGTAT